jgi:hypothetical protein
MAPNAARLMGDLGSDLAKYQMADLFFVLPALPREALETPAFLDLVLAGVLRSPVFDAADIRRLRSLPAYRYQGAYRDEQVEVRLVEPPAG